MRTTMGLRRCRPRVGSRGGGVRGRWSQLAVDGRGHRTDRRSMVAGTEPESGDPIELLQGTCGDPTFATPESIDGAEAAVPAINPARGINGRPVELRACNSGLDANMSAPCMQEAIDFGGIAFVSSHSVHGTQVFCGLRQREFPGWGNVSGKVPRRVFAGRDLT